MLCIVRALHMKATCVPCSYSLVQEPFAKASSSSQGAETIPKASSTDLQRKLQQEVFRALAHERDGLTGFASEKGESLLRPAVLHLLQEFGLAAATAPGNEGLKHSCVRHGHELLSSCSVPSFRASRASCS